MSSGCITNRSSTSRSTGRWALVRWERPGAGLLLPAAFIAEAERTGQIVPLGAWVTRQACEAAVVLAQRASGPHSVSINLSARQLSEPGIVDMLADALQASGCDPGTIVIEVTETAITHDMAAATATLQAMKDLGVGLALDDFGTGYSSLLCLRQFPVDRIKIDRSFVSGLGTDPDSTAIVASTVSLAHSVGVLAVAEGVETLDQLALLRQMGCDFAQGYLFSRPLTFENLEQWLSARPSEEDPPPSDEVAEPPAAYESLLILELHRDGASLNTIAAMLNQRGLLNPRGQQWRAQSVAKVIARAEFPTLPLGR